eukprot:1224997-Pyramimonas_sp.AAC.1
MVGRPRRRPRARAAAEQAPPSILGPGVRDVGLEHLRAPRILAPRVAKLGLGDPAVGRPRLEDRAPAIVRRPIPPSSSPRCHQAGSIVHSRIEGRTSWP